MTEAYPQNFIDPPTRAECEELDEIRSRAESDPLERGHQLEWMGLRPPLEEGVLPPTDYPHGRSTSPNPLRPLHSLLVDPQLGPSSTSWSLTLTEALQSGAHHFSQVWRAQASPAGDPSSTFPVVVKLYQQSLFPPPRAFISDPVCDSWNWQSAEYRQERELPSGEEVVGVVLEDLVEHGRALNLEAFLIREAKGNRVTASHFAAIASEALRFQNRFHELELANTSCLVENFLYLRESPRSPALVGIGFGKARSKEMDLVGFKLAQADYGFPDDHWCQQEQLILYGRLEESLWGERDGQREIPMEWGREEEQKQTLTFLKRPWC